MKIIKAFSFLLLFALAMYQCKDVETIPETETCVEDDPFGVGLAKAWYEENYPDELELKSGEKNMAKVSMRKEWKKSFNQQDGKYHVVETDLVAEGKFGMALPDAYENWNTTQDNSWIEPVTRLVIMKSKIDGRVDAFIMVLAGDKDYLNTKRGKLVNNHYLKKNNDFSGIVMFYEINGTFNSGWQYSDGNLTGKIIPHDTASVNVQLKSAPVCIVTTIYTMYQECRYYPNYEYATDVVCDPPVIEVSAISIECIPSEYTGGGTYIPAIDSPCDCNNCPVCGGCLELDLKNATLPGSGGTPTVSCPECSCPKVITTDPSFIGTKADCVYGKLENTSLLKNLQSAFELSEKYNLTYKVVDFLTPVNSTEQPYGTQLYNDQLNTSTININSYYFDKVVPVTIANTILHETIHASIAQNIDRAGGLSGLDANDFEELIVYYYKNSLNAGLADHSIISQWYVPLMANTLAKFDNFKFDSSKYTALAWHGLQETYLWKIKTSTEQENIRAIWKEINNGIKDCEL